MKRLICFALAIVLFLLPSCAPAAKEPEPPKVLTGTLSSAIRITPAALEIETSTGETYVFPGNVIEADRGLTPGAAAEQLRAQGERGALCPPIKNTVTLEFPDAVPTSVACYNHYYLDAAEERFLYEDLQKTLFLEPTKSSVSVPLQMDMAFALNSVLTSHSYCRILRLVCSFEAQTVEYYIFSPHTAE